MRIALFHNLPSGGAKRAVYEWTRRLAQRHDIDVFSCSTADRSFCDITPYTQAYCVYEFATRRLFRSPWGRLNQLQRWRDLGGLSALGRRLAQEIDHRGYDVVLANTCMFTFIPTFVRYVQTPTVYYLHEPFGRTFIRQHTRDASAKCKWRTALDRCDPLIALYGSRLERLQRSSVAGASRLLANSRFTQEQFKLAFNIESEVCRYGVDCEVFRPRIAHIADDHVLSVGELTPRKGFDFLIESLARIPLSTRPSLRLACNAVNPDEKMYIESLAAERGVKLEILTGLDSQRLAAAYGEARLCVYAPVAEPFGLVPLEAMACGKPVVAVREGGVPESVIDGQTGLLVPRDPTTFANAVQQLLADPLLAERLGVQARQHVLQNWTWEKSVAELEDLLSSRALVRGHPDYHKTAEADQDLPRLVRGTDSI